LRLYYTEFVLIRIGGMGWSLY